MTTEKRKADHIDICLAEGVETGSTWFEKVKLIHKAIPNIDFREIDTGTELLGKTFSFPLLIDSMTGGTEKAEKINKTLAVSAQKHGIAFSVGSQRAGLEEKNTAKTYQVRDIAPDVFLIANLGLVQFVNGYKPEQAAQAVDMIKADALALHLNSLQEICQPEGDVNWKNTLEAVKDVVNAVDVPVIAKETGAGISKDIAKELEKSGVSAINVAGHGGTSWSLVESYRSGAENLKEFSDWGIPTAAAVLECSSAVKIPLMASGGIRNGIDAVKSMVLGASFTGVAKPFLMSAVNQDMDKVITRFKQGFAKTMFLIGSKSLPELQKADYVLLDELKQWQEQRT